MPPCTPQRPHRHSRQNAINADITLFGPLSYPWVYPRLMRELAYASVVNSSPLPSVTDGKRSRAEAPLKCTLADTHMNSSEKLQFYKEKTPDCHGPVLKHEAISSQESKKSKKRPFEESETEQNNSSQPSKQKYVCLAVEDWDLLNSY